VVEIRVRWWGMRGEDGIGKCSSFLELV